MDLPKPPPAVAALAAFLRARLAEVSGSIGPLLARPDAEVVLRETDRAVLGAARQLRTVIVGAAAPFAPNAYSRARLIRQMHASGLLTGDEVRRTTHLLELDPAGLDAFDHEAGFEQAGRRGDAPR